MKIKEGYLLRTIAGENIVVPVAERVIEFKGMILLNEMAASLWEYLQEDREYEEIVGYVTSEYDIDKETAEKDLQALLKQMEDGGVLEK